MKNTRKINRFLGKSLRGLSLLEAILALGIGGVVITQSILGLTEYTTSVQVQASASKLKILTRAADRFSTDNYNNLIADAPQEFNISVLAPYVGDNIGPDAFGNEYLLTTRTYEITVEDPVNGGTKQEQALQVLLVGKYADPNQTPMTTKLTLRADIANTAGASAGFIALDQLTCSDGAGGTAPDGAICGSFGAYSINSSEFPASNFNNAALVSLTTKGDGSVYGDQLYRYDYGDPDLNTMRTTLFMDNNDIVNPDKITGVNAITMDAPGNSVIKTEGGSNLRLESDRSASLTAGSGSISLSASDNQYNLATSSAGAFATLKPQSGKLRVDSDETIFGETIPHTHGGNSQLTGTGNIWAGVAYTDKIRTNELNSLFAQSNDVLRLQSNRNNGEVVIGKRARYNPGGGSGVYELSDGDLTAQHVQVQDITCADCGGSLASVLPKWRHMGTYFVPNSTGVIVPKPRCGTDSRRRKKNRGAIGNNPSYAEGGNDTRYQPKIILIPRQFAFQRGTGPDAAGVIDFRFNAYNSGSNWVVSTHAQSAYATALAKTYCVFVGNGANPTSTMGPLQSSNGGGFTRIE